MFISLATDKVFYLMFKTVKMKKSKVWHFWSMIHLPQWEAKLKAHRAYYMV